MKTRNEEIINECKRETKRMDNWGKLVIMKTGEEINWLEWKYYEKNRQLKPKRRIENETRNYWKGILWNGKREEWETMVNKRTIQ